LEAKVKKIVVNVANIEAGVKEIVGNISIILDNLTSVHSVETHVALPHYVETQPCYFHLLAPVLPHYPVAEHPL